jgi:guanylate kinase
LNDRKIIVITAPSGSGKTTLVKRLLQQCAHLAFSVSACTRSPRPNEVHGKDYYFYDEQFFKQLIDSQAFVEWEMVYPGKYYGTLHTEMNRIWENGQVPLVDIDVRGALAIKAAYPQNALTIFIEAPSMEELRRRLVARGTETAHTLNERLEKAAYEVSFAPQFDKIVVNETLDKATEELLQLINDFCL